MYYNLEKDNQFLIYMFLSYQSFSYYREGKPLQSCVSYVSARKKVALVMFHQLSQLCFTSRRLINIQPFKGLLTPNIRISVDTRRMRLEWVWEPFSSVIANTRVCMDKTIAKVWCPFRRSTLPLYVTLLNCTNGFFVFYGHFLTCNLMFWVQINTRSATLCRTTY